MKRIFATLSKILPFQFPSLERSDDSGLGVGSIIKTNNPPLNLLRVGDFQA